MHAISLHFMYYNFGRNHQTRKETPAMEAGITDTLFDLDIIVKLIDDRAPAPRNRGHYQKRILN
jgi:hypothetical protein